MARIVLRRCRRGMPAAVGRTTRARTMEITNNCKLAEALASRLSAAREELTQRWLERIAARVELDPNRVFPTDDLLDHVPILVERIADYMRDPADEITADAPVTAKAIELGELRYRQGFDAHQIMKEYELLGGILFSFLIRAVDDIPEPCTRGELLACAHRLFRGVSIIQQVTTAQYLRLANERVSEREERLRSFNRMVSHELKNRIGAVLGAGQILGDPELAADPQRRERFARMVVENANAMQDVLENLIQLSRMDGETRQHRNVLLPYVAAEVARGLREMAQARGVEVRVEPGIPEVEVNAAGVELCLSNYLSNAIKYCDPAKGQRWVRIAGSTVEGELVVAVEDNGLGVPAEARESLFSRFFRAHGDTAAVEGTGLGLSIVRETVEAMGGRAWAEFDGPAGTRFLIALPCRRSADNGTAIRNAD
jgi:signal transduction histidine kinase